MKLASVVLAVTALGLGSGAFAGQAYQARGFLRSGYSDKVLAPGKWSVRGSSHDRDKSIGVALYHAAELAARGGFAEIRVIRQQVRSQTMSERRSNRILSYSEATTLTVHAVRSAADRAACEMPEARQCLTLPVAGIMATYGPELRMPAGLPGAPVAAALPIRTTSPYQAAVAAFVASHPEWASNRSVPASQSALPSASGRRIAARAVDTRPNAAEEYEKRLRAAQPVKSDPALGWSVVE